MIGVPSHLPPTLCAPKDEARGLALVLRVAAALQPDEPALRAAHRDLGRRELVPHVTRESPQCLINYICGW